MKVLSIIMAVVLVVAGMLLILTLGWTNVQPTEVAVQVNKLAGSVSPEPLGVGYQFYNRWKTQLVKYNAAVRSFPEDVQESEQSKAYTLDLKTKDGQNVNIDLTILVSLRRNEVPKLHTEIGPLYVQQVLLPQLRSESRIIIGGYAAEELYQGTVRNSIQMMLLSKLKESCLKYPAIEIQDALIRHLQFSAAFEQAIEQKKLAAQTVEINKNLALAQEETAKKQEAEARGLKLQAVQSAEGTAQAMKINADAQRYKLEQEAAGTLAKLKAEAEGKRLLAEAMGGGQNVVNLAFAERISPALQVWGIPVGANNTSLMDISGMFGNMFPKSQK